MDKQLLTEAAQALDDWIITYAAEEYDRKHVRAAWERIIRGGGTIAYATDLRERIQKALKNENEL